MEDPEATPAMSAQDYLSTVIAPQLVHELEPILKIKEVTDNTELLGTYAESVLRRLSRRVVHPLHVSTGAVLQYPMPPLLRQIDLIIWAPFPAPSIFEVDDFSLVPQSSAFGAIEIKRSNYSGTDEKLEEFVNTVPSLINSQDDQDDRFAAMGVVCVLENPPSARLQKLFDAQKALAIFDKTASAISLRSVDVLRLINFLYFVGWRYRRRAMLLTGLNTQF